MPSAAYSVIVPPYRGEATVVELYRRLVQFFEARASSFEILLVDDGSTDGSWKRIQEISAEDGRVIGLRLTRNFGQHNATVCGFRHTSGEMVLTSDEDLQLPPEGIGKLIDRAERGMMSEYLAHTFLHVIRKPQSVVRETTART